MLGLRSSAAAAAVAVVACVGAGHSVAETLTLNQYVLPKHIVVTEGTMPVIEALKERSGGAIDVRLFTGGTPLSAQATLGGLQSGVVDAGMVILTYHPAELPTVQYLNDLAVPTDNTNVVAAAFNEYVLSQCARCLSEFADAGVVFTGSYTAAPLVLVSREVYASADDLKGKKVRIPGGDFNSRWADYFGLSPVNVGGSEIYEMMNRGAVDITLNPAAILRTHSLAEVARSVLALPVAMHRVSSPFVFAKDSWADLSPEQRRIFLDLAPLAMIRITDGYAKEADDVLATAGTAGIEVIEPSPALREKMAAFLEEDLETIYRLAKEQYGIEDPQTVRSDFLALIAKWDAIAEEVGDDPQALGERLREDVYAKLDAATYGVD